MYLSKENIQCLNEIVRTINEIDSTEEQSKFLEEHVEDVETLLKTLKKVNKNKIVHINKKETKKNDCLKTQVCEYTKNDIYKIFSEHDNDEIANQYSLSNLKNMYTSIYESKPMSKYGKKEIIDILRNRCYSIKRAEAFEKLAKERSHQLQ